MDIIPIRRLLPNNTQENNMLDTIVGNLLLVGKNTKSVAVTSCRDGDGKSTVALGIACSLASEGKKTAFIDACVSNPLFKKAENEKSISEYLEGKCELQDVVYTTDVNNLYIITQIFRNFELNATDFSKFMDKLTSEYDHIIVDTSSVFKTIHTTKISSICDGILLVTRYGKTKKRDISEAVHQLERSGSPIIGCVINRVKFDSIISMKRYRFWYTPLFKKILRRRN